MGNRLPPDGATRVTIPPGTSVLAGGPPFPMPRISFTPPPMSTAGGGDPGVSTYDPTTGTVTVTGRTELWIIVTPGWASAAFGHSDYFCPPDGQCGPHGPRCSGQGNSGWIYDLYPRMRTLPQQTTITTGGSVTPILNPTYTGIYVTQHPYIPGSLDLSFQGQTLVKGVDYIELDPAAGTFQILKLVPEESAGELFVSYYGYGDQNSSGTGTPTQPPTEPGQPVPPPLPGSGGTYRPANQRQFGWGTIYDSVNCNMACSAMLLDRHTMGRNTRYVGSPQSIPPSHRFYSGVTAITGTGHDDAAKAWRDGWGQSYVYPGPTSWSYVVTQIQYGRGATIFGRYAYMADQYKKSKTYNGPHAIYINEQQADGTFWGYDPIVGYPIVYPYDVLHTYADSYHGFRDRIEAGFSQVTPRV